MQRDGQKYWASPGSKSTACNQSNKVNVGDPDRSIMEESIGKPKCKSEATEKAIRKSEGS